MMSIDYPSDFNASIAAALAHPCLIDSRGNLYVLREDGATVLVAGPEAYGSVQFQGVGSGPTLSWAATQERLFVCFAEGEHQVQALLPCASTSGQLPEYRRCILNVVSPSIAYFLHNTPDALYCFAVSTSGVSLVTQVDRHNGRGAWLEEGNLYVFGMRSRIRKTGKYVFSKGEWFSLKYGIGMLARIELSSGRVYIDSAEATNKALAAAWKTDTGEGEHTYVKPKLEAWLDSVETTQGRVLIGGIMDERPSEFDDTFEEPQPSDFSGIALYRWHGQKDMELLRLLRGVRYIGRMTGSAGEVLYFVRGDDPRDVFTDQHYAMRVSPDMQSPLMPLAFDWADRNLWTVQFDPSWDERVGAMAAVTTKIRDTPLPYRRHLALSNDGLAWRLAHPLPEE